MKIKFRIYVTPFLCDKIDINFICASFYSSVQPSIALTGRMEQFGGDLFHLFHLPKMGHQYLCVCNKQHR